MDAGVAERDDTYMLVVVVVVVDRYRVVSWDRCVSPGSRPDDDASRHTPPTICRRVHNTDNFAVHDACFK